MHALMREICRQLGLKESDIVAEVTAKVARRSFDARPSSRSAESRRLARAFAPAMYILDERGAFEPIYGPGMPIQYPTKHERKTT
jgi:hypothetical protein